VSTAKAAPSRRRSACRVPRPGVNPAWSRAAASQPAPPALLCPAGGQERGVHASGEERRGRRTRERREISPHPPRPFLLPSASPAGGQFGHGSPTRRSAPLLPSLLPRFPYSRTSPRRARGSIRATGGSPHGSPRAATADWPLRSGILRSRPGVEVPCLSPLSLSLSRARWSQRRRAILRAPRGARGRRRIPDLSCMRGAWRFPRFGLLVGIVRSPTRGEDGLGRGARAGAGMPPPPATLDSRACGGGYSVLALRPGGFGAFTSLSGDVRVRICRPVWWHPVVVAKYLFLGRKKGLGQPQLLGAAAAAAAAVRGLGCPLCDSHRVDRAVWDIYSDAPLCSWLCGRFRLVEGVVC
jgi:hypothetical protein